MATKSIAWQTGNGNITLTYQGRGDGTIIVKSDANNLGSVRSQTIAIQTVNGAISRNLTISQAACPVPVGSVKNFGYTGAVQSITLPAGTYKLQCWGAQGGSNAAYSTYGITAQAGGKGGYSEGVITLTKSTTVYVFVGGQGYSSGKGGFNGGGGGTGTCTATVDDVFGYTKIGGGGGATDIALVTSSMNYLSNRTNRSSASLLSRMIVAGGGSGGAMAYKLIPATTGWKNLGSITLTNGASGTFDGKSYTVSRYSWGSGMHLGARIAFSSTPWPSGTRLRITYVESSSVTVRTYAYFEGNEITSGNEVISTGNKTNELATESAYSSNVYPAGTFTVEKYVEATSGYFSQVGFAGGGTTGDGYADRYKGKQNAGGTGSEGGGFGIGVNQRDTVKCFHAGLGGAGWYGGGCTLGNDDYAENLRGSGGGSGFVNTAANASYRPSGYTGLELDSGTTVAGNTSFEAPGGGTETGHAGNGYARITRLS